jgi:hypothetical protein
LTVREARAFLELYRPGTADGQDPEMARALELARREPELQRWFERHCAFQAALRVKFRQIAAPERLREKLLAERKIVPLPWWHRRTAWLAAAAAVVLLASLAVLVLPDRVPDRLADFRVRMVRTALRQYQMDIATNDLQQVRRFMAAQGAPSDYDVPPGLSRLTLTGGVVLKWRNHPVSMVCFDRGGSQMLYLFVTESSALKDAPGETPRVARVNKLLTASWQRAGHTYMLAGFDEPGFPRKYL